MTNTRGALAAMALALMTTSAPVLAKAAPARPWMNTALTPDQRADLMISQMTQAEKLTLVSGYFGTDLGAFKAPKGSRDGVAGFVPGVERLGLPPQWQSDAGVGVATQGAAKIKFEKTALPSGLSTTASWNPDLAYRGGAMLGAESRASGMNVQLAGGVDLMRDPRNGRNFEYGGEDPLLAGVMVGAQIRGIQSNGVISTVKHYAFNDQETGRTQANAIIGDAAGRMSDLLAFEIAIEQSDAGSVMCSYNRVNGAYACQNDHLLNQVLKGDWGFKGYVMSDWGATHSTADSANRGLDQETGVGLGQVKPDEYYGSGKLAKAIAAGEVSQSRLDDMVHRIVRTMFARGVVDHPVAVAPIDFAADAKVTQADEEQGIVLLKNAADILPLKAELKRIAIIGSHANVGVLSGGGSAQVYPVGKNAVPGLEPTGWPGPVVYDPSSPMTFIQTQAAGAHVAYAEGDDIAAAARLAARSEIAIVFVHQWTAESQDFALTLPDNQDALVAAVAAANPHTIVVVESGGPVFMPWADKVQGLVEAWYPGTAGGAAIADVLFGKVDASGRLPATFPRDLSQLVRHDIDGAGLADDKGFDVHYFEGAAVGYKWFDAHHLEPLFPFGYGLSYSHFAYSDLKATLAGDEVTVSFAVKNVGARPGMDVPQVYVSPQAGGWEAPKRLAGFKKVELAPGQSTEVSVVVDPRLLAVFDETAHGWRRAAGLYKVMLGASSRDMKATTGLQLPAQTLPASFHP
jgi:beta-glucosidase